MGEERKAKVSEQRQCRHRSNSQSGCVLRTLSTGPCARQTTPTAKDQQGKVRDELQRRREQPRGMPEKKGCEGLLCASVGRIAV